MIFEILMKILNEFKKEIVTICGGYTKCFIWIHINEFNVTSISCLSNSPQLYCNCFHNLSNKPMIELFVIDIDVCCSYLIWKRKITLYCIHDESIIMLQVIVQQLVWDTEQKQELAKYPLWFFFIMREIWLYIVCHPEGENKT